MCISPTDTTSSPSPSDSASSIIAGAVNALHA
jgi:hypothetical protein